MKLNNKKDLEELVREMVKDIVSSRNIGESDLIAKSTSDWEQVKADFKQTINGLLKDIEDDNYDNANNQIDKAVTMLNKWKTRIEKVIDEDKPSV
jgi:hypothetical protein